MGYVLVTPAASYPISRDEAKLRCKEDGTSRDDEIDALIAEATDHIQTLLGKELVSETWNLILDEWADEILIDKAPVQSVSWIKYNDADGAEQTLSTAIYQVDTDDAPQRIVLADGASWPDLDAGISNITIQFVVGNADESAKAAIALYIVSRFDDPTGEKYEPTARAIKSTLYPKQTMVL